MKIFFIITIISYSLLAEANDGVYFASGNHLIPIQESQISISKEILKIERIESNYLLIHVDYTFYNPKDEMEILVGFEAPSPSGDADGTPVNGKHPYISDFEVIMNGHALPFNCAIVQTKAYYADEQIEGLSEQEAMGQDFEMNSPDFFYVYQFKLSSSTEQLFSFEYILTAANRWANKQIDDFTLILDLGDFVDYNVQRTFFKDSENWCDATKFLEGKKMVYSEEEANTLRIITNDTPTIYKQKNFRPKGELLIYKESHSWEKFQGKVFDYQTDQLPYSFEDFKHIFKTKGTDSYKILRNLPFARRGHVFKNASIQQYYESLSWYQPNPMYKVDFNSIGKVEQEWLKTLKKITLKTKKE